MAPSPLFLIGNKRSGSTLLVNLLNRHPEVFVTHESDIIWILNQASLGWPGGRRCHPLDAPRGMESTLRACDELIHERLGPNAPAQTIREVFFEVLHHIMRNGSDMDKAFDKSGLAWIGDKKPVQHVDPSLSGFIQLHFPDARFLHVVRHPRNVVASMSKAARSWRFVPEPWRGSREQILDHWAQNEEWVLAARRRYGDGIHTVRLEDLCAAPRETMTAVFAFLDLETPPRVAARVEQLVDPGSVRDYGSFEIDPTTRLQALMRRYGYS